jgi:hypothetical protein
MSQKPLDREPFVNWSIVVVENPILGPKFRPFSIAELHATAIIFPHNKPG